MACLGGQRTYAATPLTCVDTQLPKVGHYMSLETAFFIPSLLPTCAEPAAFRNRSITSRLQH